MHRRFCWVAVLLVGIGGPATAQEFVINGDFETDAEEFIVYPGYVGFTNDAGDLNPDEIPDWFGTGGRGINPIFAPTNPAEIMAWPGSGGRGINPVFEADAPFRDNGDNDTQAAFIQNTGVIEQLVSGLTVGSTYTLSFEFNSRNCCDGYPVGDLQLNGNSIDVPDFNEEVFPVLDFNPWYEASYEFQADSTDLNIAFFSEPIGADATMLLDNIMLLEEGSENNLVVNGDFELDEFPIWPGYVGAGLSSPFNDNGNNSSAIAFLQGTASLSQIVEGLTVGEEYTFSIDFNARNCCGGEVPFAELLFDGDVVADFPGNGLDGTVVPVGGSEPWYHYETTFMATSDQLEIMISTFPEAGGDSTLIIDNVSVSQPSPSVPGDFNGDGLLTATDIDLLTEEVLAGTNLAEFDLTGDGLVNGADRDLWVDELKYTYFGDANLDGEFNSSDFVLVFTRGKYEDATPFNATWEDGDWNGDGDFTSSDFVKAFTGGGYELGPKAAVSAVPEPSGAILLLLGLIGFVRRR